MFRGNDAAFGKLKISGLVDLISCLDTRLGYELLDIHPVQKRRVLDTLNLSIDRDGVTCQSFNEVSRTKYKDIGSAAELIKCNQQSINGLSE